VLSPYAAAYGDTGGGVKGMLSPYSAAYGDSGGGAKGVLSPYAAAYGRGASSGGTGASNAGVGESPAGAVLSPYARAYGVPQSITSPYSQVYSNRATAVTAAAGGPEQGDTTSLSPYSRTYKGAAAAMGPVSSPDPYSSIYATSNTAGGGGDRYLRVLSPEDDGDPLSSDMVGLSVVEEAELVAAEQLEAAAESSRAEAAALRRHVSGQHHASGGRRRGGGGGFSPGAQASMDILSGAKRMGLRGVPLEVDNTEGVPYPGSPAVGGELSPGGYYAQGGYPASQQLMSFRSPSSLLGTRRPRE